MEKESTRELEEEMAMRRVFTALEHLVRDERAQDLLEYALLVVLIAIGAVVAVGALGNAISERWLNLAPIIQSI